jgi:hypothetical protein
LLLVPFGRVRALRGLGKAVCAAALCVICGFGAGCADAASTTARPFPAHVAVEKSKSERFCAYEISVPTNADARAISRYWTRLARSAVRVVSEGKMTVTVPKEHLTRSQRRALRLAEWAERAFSPKPRLVCIRLPGQQAPPRSGGPPRAGAGQIPGSTGQGKGRPASALRLQPIQLTGAGNALVFTLKGVDFSRQVILGDEHLHIVW